MPVCSDNPTDRLVLESLDGGEFYVCDLGGSESVRCKCRWHASNAKHHGKLSMTFYDAYMEPQDTSSRVKKQEMVSA